VSSTDGVRRVYFEDVEVGVVLETPGLTVTPAHTSLYTGVTGDREGHAPGSVPFLLCLCLSSGLGWRIPRPPLAILAFMGFEWRSVAPVRVGDTIRCRFRTAAKRSMREGGVVIEERTLVNQRDVVVQSGKATLLVARRPAS
jgi:acyl dehydratase